MAGRVSQYTVVDLLLTVAGKEVVDGPWSICRFLDAVDGVGDVDTDAKITVKAEREAEAAPLRLGQGFLARDTKRWIIEWEAQAGVTATLGFSQKPEDTDWDADPAAQLLTGSIKLKGSATFTSVADVSITATSTVQVVAANSTRRELIISNLAANIQTMRVGDAGAAAAEGIELAPGETLFLDVTTAVYAYNPGAGAESLAVVEVAD